MQTTLATPLPAHKAAFLLGWQQHKPVVTLAHLDADSDDAPLMELIGQQCEGIGRSISFRDDNRQRGYRAYEFDVRLVTGYEWDEDGCSPVVSLETISVAVLASESIETIAGNVVAEIRSLIESL